MCEPRGCGGGARVSPAPGGAPGGGGRARGGVLNGSAACPQPESASSSRLLRWGRGGAVLGPYRRDGGGCPGAGGAETSGGSENYRVLRRLLLIAAARVEVRENRGRGGDDKTGSGGRKGRERRKTSNRGTRPPTSRPWAAIPGPAGSAALPPLQAGRVAACGLP